jgi:drug/metabolite transporter (DMT)-like permease
VKTATASAPRHRGATRAPVSAVAWVALGAAMWGTDGALRAPLVPRWPASTIVLYEHLILTAVVIVPLLAERLSIARIPRRGWLAVLAVSWGGSALATLAFTTAFMYGNPDVVVLLQKTQPLFALVAAAVLLGERPRASLAPLAAAAVVGTYLLSFGWTSPTHAFSGGQGKAAALALVAAAMWGTATALGRVALAHTSSATLSGLRFVLAVPVLVVVAASRGALAAPDVASVDWARLLVLALVPGLVGILLYYWGLEQTPASIATFAELAFPATAVVVNYLVLGATVDAAQLCGFGVLWVTIALLHRVPVRTGRAQADPRSASTVGAVDPLH